MNKTINLIGQTIPRMGYGTMRLTGPNIWGPPKDHDEAIRVLKKTQELGIKAIDTAWYYGPNISNQLLAEALRPYADDLIIITKLGGNRDDKGDWLPFTKPDELHQGMENDLKTLQRDSIPVVHLRWMEGGDDEFQAAVDTMIAMKQEGKLQNIGLSNVTEAQLDYVLAKTPVATVSNIYSFQNQADNAMVDRCEQEGIAYLPFFPLAVGKADDVDVLREWAQKLNATATQIALAWLLHRSPCILPIPGTSSVAHLEENFAALNLELPNEALEALAK